MKKQLGLLFAVIMVLNMAGSVSLARSPLENYNLYDDVMDLREEYTVEDTDTIKNNFLASTFTTIASSTGEPIVGKTCFLVIRMFSSSITLIGI